MTKSCLILTQNFFAISPPKQIEEREKKKRDVKKRLCRMCRKGHIRMQSAFSISLGKLSDYTEPVFDPGSYQGAQGPNPTNLE